MIIAICSPSNPNHLWNTYKEEMTMDILHSKREAYNQFEMTISDDMLNEALIMVEDQVMKLCDKTIDCFGIQAPLQDTNSILSRRLIEETSYDIPTLTSSIDENVPKLLPDQLAVLTKTMDSIENEKGITIFVDAPGGTGKTFVTNLILAKVRSRKEIALAVASSGNAATLLAGGRTAHSMFKT